MNGVASRLAKNKILRIFIWIIWRALFAAGKIKGFNIKVIGKHMARGRSAFKMPVSYALAINQFVLASILRAWADVLYAIKGWLGIRSRMAYAAGWLAARRVRVSQRVHFFVWIRVHRMPRFFIESWQLWRLRTTLARAYRYVPFYSRFWDACGVDTNKILRLGDIRALPVISKQFLKSVPENDRFNINLPVKYLEECQTSGSTGEPFRFVVSRRYDFNSKFGLIPAYTTFTRNSLRFILWRGLSSQIAWECHSAVAEIKIHSSPWGKRYLHIPTSEMRISPQSVIEKLRSFRPNVLNTRSTLLVELARISERLPYGERPRPDFIIAHGEMLSQTQREYIKSILGTEPHEIYGLTETDDIALDCHFHNGLHIHEESFIVEILDGRGQPLPPGEMGRIIVTDLSSSAMTFIRYDTGDRGMILAEPCPCGLSSKRLMVKGRVGGFMEIGGRRYNYAEFQMILSRAGHFILRYQLAKVAGDKLELRIIPTSACSTADLERLFGEFRNDLGISPLIKVVDEIAYSDSGKTHFIIDETGQRRH